MWKMHVGLSARRKFKGNGNENAEVADVPVNNEIKLVLSEKSR